MKKIINHIFKFPAYLAIMGMVLISCNKDVPAPVPITFQKPTGTSIGTIINTDPNYSFLKTALTRAGLMTALLDSSRSLTLFAPDNAAFIASGIPSEAVVNALPLTDLVPLLQYHLVSQKLTSTQIPATFPNLQWPTFLNPAPTVSALLRLNTYPSTSNGAWVNNIPIKQANTEASNGVIHTVAALVAPPSRFLWNRIDTDPDLTYLKAAIKRADSGFAPINLSSLEYTLNTIGPNLTVFAPTNAAFQAIITGLAYQTLVAQGIPPANALPIAQQLASTPDVFSNPALFPVLTPTTVKGIVVYHLLTSRAFSNNMPVTATAYPTALNGAIATHPGVTIQATFGVPFVTAITVKGVANATAANVLVNPAREPNGTSDQHYVNGVLHKIDQVLLPQ